MKKLVRLGTVYWRWFPIIHPPISQLAERARLDPEERRHIRYYALANTFLGVLDLDQNLPESALVHLRNAVRVHPDPQALYTLAQAYYRVKNWETAGSVCKRVLELEPNDIEAWRLQSMIAREQGDERQMAMALEKVLLLSPKDRQARYELAWVWAAAKESTLRHPAAALRVARELWEESRGQSSNVRELLDAAQRASTHD